MTLVRLDPARESRTNEFEIEAERLGGILVQEDETGLNPHRSRI